MQYLTIKPPETASMLNRIEKKIKTIKKDLLIIARLKPDCDGKIYADPIYRGALLHYLYIVSDSCISIAEMIIKYKDFEQPESWDRINIQSNRRNERLVMPVDLSGLGDLEFYFKNKKYMAKSKLELIARENKEPAFLPVKQEIELEKLINEENEIKKEFIENKAENNEYEQEKNIILKFNPLISP